MTGNRPVVIRLALLATCVAAFSSAALITPKIFAQDSSSADQIHQACLEHLNSWVFKSGNSSSCQCDQCSECGDRCAKTDSPSTSSKQEGQNETVAWTELSFVDESEPINASCEGPCCTQSGCNKSDCCDDKLGMCSDCDFCRDVCAMPENSAYCKDLSELLCMSLKGSDMSEPAMQSVIEKAMMLVAKNAQSESLIALAEMQAKHEEEKAAMRGQLVQLSTQVHTVNDLRNWIGPLYANQNRTIQHIQLMSAGSNALNRTLTLLEKQLSSKAATPPIAVKYSNPHVVQPDPKSEVYDLKRQISELKQQLQKMRQIQTDKIQPAQHLQPIYNSNQQLEPLESPPFQSNNWVPTPKRR